jgi:hypothetical protein
MAIAEALRTNTRLARLGLSFNCMEGSASAALAAALAVNSNLTNAPRSARTGA